MRKRAAKSVFREAFPVSTIEMKRSRSGPARYIVREEYDSTGRSWSGETITEAWCNACLACRLTGYIGEPSPGTR